MCVTSNSAEVLELEKDGTVSPISGYRIKLRRPDIRGVLRLGVNIRRQYNAEVSRVSRDEPSGKGTQPRARRGFLVGEAMAGTNKCKQCHIALPHIAYVTIRHFTAAILRFDHDGQIPTAKGTAKRSPIVEYGHRWRESRERGLEHHTSCGCFWPCRSPSRHDPRELLRPTRWDTPGSHIARIRWPTNRIMLNSGCPVLISVKPLNGG